MQISSNGQDNLSAVQIGQRFGAPAFNTSQPYSPYQQFGGGFQQFPFPQQLLQNLIQQVVSQLLQSLFNQNSNQATPFNDILRGGDNAELIRGFGGNDQLYGNGGNDILEGGQGHDYLNGGQGNDSLFGGAGNDLLQDDFGRNHFVGGDGHDTLRLNDQFSNYTIEKNYTNFEKGVEGDIGTIPIDRPYNGFIITNNATGDFNTVESVENFQFADGNISADQLARHIDITQAPQEVTLTGDQDSAIRDRFDIGNGSTYRVLDQDNSQSLSAGDELEITIGGDAISVVTLTDEDVDVINNGPSIPLELNLNEQDTSNLNKYFNQGTSHFAGTVLDQDGSGTLSEGDIAKLTIGGFAGDIDVDHVITAQDLEAINSNNTPQELSLSDTEKQALEQSLVGLVLPPDGLPLPDSLSINSVSDKDSDGKPSVGDLVIASYTKPDGTAGSAGITLTQANIDKYQSILNPSQDLNLTQEQHDAIGARFNQLPPPLSADFPTTSYEGTTIDKNGDGKLSEGDTVKLRTSGGFGLPGQTDQVTEHVLTADDIAFIESDRSDPLLNISSGLSNNQQQRLNNALFGDNISLSNPRADSIFDTNSDGKLSVGDYAQIRSFDETIGVEGIGFIQITQDHIDTFLEGKNTDALAALQENQQKWEESGAEQNGYSFRLERSAFTTPENIRPTISHVNPAGDVFDVFADTGRAVPENYSQANASVDSLFDIIQDAIDSQADGVTVQYDPTTGYPTSIFIDYQERLSDDELSLNISNLVIK